MMAGRNNKAPVTQEINNPEKQSYLRELFLKYHKMPS
jgi:hypothetical protein